MPWLPWQPALIPPLLFYRPFRLSSTTHYCSLSLSLSTPPFPHLSLSLYHFSLFSVEHRDTDAYIDLRNTEEKNLFSYSVLACYTAFASPFFSVLPPSHFIPIQRISSLCFLILVIFESSVDYSSSCSKLRKRLRVALGVEMKG